jgi:DNA-binding transcriptional MerR regulator
MCYLQIKKGEFMQMQKRRFRIGDLAKQLNVDKFVIRFWEKEFTLSPARSCGGQRFYEEKDFEKFKEIKTLLYEKKFTIAGAKEQLNEQFSAQNLSNKKIICATKDTAKKTLNLEGKNSLEEKNYDFINKALDLRKNLVKLRRLIS